MEKNDVIQVRVSPEKKAEYKALAKAQGMDLSEWLRYLADQESMDIEQATGEERRHGREPEPVKERPAKASVEEARPVGSTPTPSADKRFKQLVAQLQGKGRNLTEAEAEARKRLGME